MNKFKLALDKESTQAMYDQDVEDHIVQYAKLKAKSKEGLSLIHI